MTARVTSIRHRKAESEDDPLRARLRGAVESARTAVAAQAQQTKAILGARALVDDAIAELEKATAAVAEAKSAQAAHTARRLSGSAASALPNTVQEARDAQSHAADELEVARLALAELEENLPEVLAAAKAANDEMDMAVAAVRLQAAAQVLARAAELKVEFQRVSEILYALTMLTPTTPGGTHALIVGANVPLSKFKDTEAWRRVMENRDLEPKDRARIEPSITAWQEWITALQTDPDARPPE
jgi:hypothetical protein